MFGLNIGRLGRGRAGGAGGAVSPVVRLWQNNEQGVWYDPSDWSTLFQDAAGTIPVTAVEQPVGMMMDKSGRGNHATQATAGNRPVLGARVNILSSTENLTDATWTKSNVIVSAAAVPLPPGALDASSVIESTATGAHAFIQAFGVISGNNYRTSISAKTNGRQFFQVMIGYGALTVVYATFDLLNGTIVATSHPGTASIVSLGDGWWTCSVTRVADGSGSTNILCYLVPLGTSAMSASYTGDGVSGIYVTQADTQLVSPTNRYQRVNTPTSYDSVGFPKYLSFNGSNQSMSSPVIDFSALNKMTVAAGVQAVNLAPAAIGMILNHSATGYNAFSLQAPNAPNAVAMVWTGDSGSAGSAIGGLASPLTATITATVDLAAPAGRMRLNGAYGPLSTAPTGGGTFKAGALFIGAMTGAGQRFFNGRIYSIIVRGAETAEPLLLAVENEVAQKTGVTLP